jgi:ATP-dependent RNA helicase SUPV3L1/SUV3
VADEVKGLDQPARATLRKHGVRFGGYHIYIPGLLKPAPRILAAQLWALKNMSPDGKGLDELRQLAAGGRTSIPIDKEVPKSLYRTVGYRVCGERAVRVDILERLADLIRPALTWREGAPGVKPAGIVEGGGFTATQAMTSLTGASGEDFASILRSLGYRVERRPKPVEAVAPVAESANAESAPVSDAEVKTEAAAEMAVATVESSDPLPHAEAPRAVETSPPIDAAAVVQEGAVAVPETDTSQAESPVSAASAAAEEPAYIDVWRPGRPSERPRHAKPRRPYQGRGPQPGEQSAAPAPAQAEIAATEPGETAPAQARKPRPPRPHRQERTDRSARPERPHRQERENRSFKPRPTPERRDKPADPNSPFAKLAALKEQLEANAKERR